MIDFSAKKWFWIVLDRSGSGNCSTLPPNLSQLGGRKGSRHGSRIVLTFGWRSCSHVQRSQNSSHIPSNLRHRRPWVLEPSNGNLTYHICPWTLGHSSGIKQSPTFCRPTIVLETLMSTTTLTSLYMSLCAMLHSRKQLWQWPPMITWSMSLKTWSS